MIRHRLSFALRLVDDFTGRKLPRTACVFTVDGRLISATYKEDGFYLFMEPIECPVTIRIEANDYFPGIVTVNREELNPSYPVVDVRLYHKPGGQFPYRCSICGGQVQPSKDGKPFMVYGVSSADSGYMLKAVKKAENGTILELSGYHKEKLTGRVFGLGSEETLDVFVILEQEGMNEYRILGELRFPHKRGEKLRPVYRTLADGNGNYVVPVAEGTENLVTVIAAADT